MRARAPLKILFVCGFTYCNAHTINTTAYSRNEFARIANKHIIIARIADIRIANTRIIIIRECAQGF